MEAMKASMEGSDESFHGSFHELPLKMQVVPGGPYTSARARLCDHLSKVYQVTITPD